MTSVRVSATRRIAAPADVAYGIIADYRDGHPRIIPPRWFRNLRVESGGVGEGTVIRFEMHAFGSTQQARGRVTEPVPGRVLIETYDDGAKTSFTVVPAEDGRAADVTILTEMKSRDGLLGVVERAVVRSFLGKAFKEELGLLDSVARERTQERSRGPSAHSANSRA
jgi:hypothetical protein